MRSELGRGTTFTRPAARRPRQRPLPPVHVQPVGRRAPPVLIVDDEPGVARALGRMMRGKHRVTVVDSGEAALERLLSGAPFDVIFCDLMMPGLTGMDLYERVRESRPELAGRFIFMTGGAFTPRARQFLEKVPNGWLEKPFDVQQIVRLMGQVLNESPASPGASRRSV